MYEIYIRRNKKELCNKLWNHKSEFLCDTLSEKKQPSSERLASGELYYSPIVGEEERVCIGEKVEQDLVSAVGSSAVNNTTRPIDPQEVLVKLVNTIGKKTHVDLLNLHIGMTFELNAIVNIKEYKYEILINGERVYLAAKNVEFKLRDTAPEINLNRRGGKGFQNLISIDGMIFMYAEPHRGWDDLHYVKSPKGRYYISHAKFMKPKGNYPIIAMPTQRAVGSFGSAIINKKNIDNQKDTFNRPYFVPRNGANTVCKEHIFTEESYRNFLDTQVKPYEEIVNNTLVMNKTVHDKISSAKKIAKITNKYNPHGLLHDLYGGRPRARRRNDPEPQAQPFRWIEHEDVEF